MWTPQTRTRPPQWQVQQRMTRPRCERPSRSVQCSISAQRSLNSTWPSLWQTGTSSSHKATLRAWCLLLRCLKDLPQTMKQMIPVPSQQIRLLWHSSSVDRSTKSWSPASAIKSSCYTQIHSLVASLCTSWTRLWSIGSKAKWFSHHRRWFECKL